MTDLNNVKRLRELAELKAQLEHSETKVSWLLRDNERVVKEKDAAYNKLYDINMALNEKIAKQKHVIELLVEQRDECLQYVSFDKEAWDAQLIAALEGGK